MEKECGEKRRCQRHFSKLDVRTADRLNTSGGTCGINPTRDTCLLLPLVPLFEFEHRRVSAVPQGAYNRPAVLAPFFYRSFFSGGPSYKLVCGGGPISSPAGGGPSYKRVCGGGSIPSYNLLEMANKKGKNKAAASAASDLNFDRSVRYYANVTVRNKMGLISVINKRLNGTPALDLLRRTCFGSWLSLRLDTNEGALIHLILQMQVPLKADHDPLVDSLIYDVGGFRVKFGAKEFCLITGFRFGEEKWRPLKTKVLPFRQRVFSHVKIGNINLEELSLLFYGDDFFKKLTPEDAVRVCLLMMLHYIFLGVGSDKGYVVDAEWLELVESLQEWNSYPWGTHFWIHTHGKLKDVVPKSREKHLATPKCKKISYSLAGFIWAFQIWIFEAFPLSQKYFVKDKSILPRGVQWISNLSFGPNQHKKFLGPFLDVSLFRVF
ncbi:uncharacterized protein [Rutidosis leptorrhynchoides]|uniref:uncharacterized protein n=1 Tax=Rutidosis leptorrhynchoides TaxID=125765 RepID=UPI003A996DE0